MKWSFFQQRFTGAGFLLVGLILFGMNHWNVVTNSRVYLYAMFLSPGAVGFGVGLLIDPDIAYIGLGLRYAAKRTRWTAVGMIVATLFLYGAVFGYYSVGQRVR